MKALQVANRQQSCPLDRRWVRRLTKCLLEDLLERRQYELGVHVIGAAEMTRLNESFLGHEGSTDVITFNHQDGAPEARLHGEIFICMDDALIHARRFRASWQSEVARYLVHGVLHLEGFDDADPPLRRAMKRRENKLLKELSARLDLGKLARECL
jgi:probable rRNA maturation factor